MRILVLGGTLFLGRAFVAATLAAGHELTLFTRGWTNPHLFLEAETQEGVGLAPEPERELLERRG